MQCATPLTPLTPNPLHHCPSAVHVSNGHIQVSKVDLEAATPATPVRQYAVGQHWALSEHKDENGLLIITEIEPGLGRQVSIKFKLAYRITKLWGYEELPLVYRTSAARIDLETSHLVKDRA